MDEAIPLEETAITNITAKNDANGTNIFTVLTTVIIFVDSVTASWKAELTKVTKKLRIQLQELSYSFVEIKQWKTRSIS